MPNARPVVKKLGVYPHQVERSIALERQAFEAMGVEYQCHIDRTIGEDAVVEYVKGADALICSGIRLGPRVLDALSGCKVIVLCSVGYDNVSVPECTKRGIMIANMPDLCTNEVADHTWALLLACARKIPRLANRVRGGIWDRSLLEPMPVLRGKTLGILGFGRIGREVAARGRGFSMRIITADPNVSAETAREHGAELVPHDRLYAEADFITCNMLLNESTRHLVDADAFKKMKRAVYFVNTARGGLVDEAALIEALRSGEIAGAGLDVLEKEPADPTNPLLTMDNVIVTAHAAGYSDDVPERMVRTAVDEVSRVLNGGTPRPEAFLNPEVVKRPALAG